MLVVFGPQHSRGRTPESGPRFSGLMNWACRGNQSRARPTEALTLRQDPRGWLLTRMAYCSWLSATES